MTRYGSAPQKAQKIAGEGPDRCAGSCTFWGVRSRLSGGMSLFFSNKVVRLFLAVSVSIWMAGGCLFGCSNSVMAADVVVDSVPTTVAGESCHSAQAHHCCAAKEATRKVVRNVTQPAGLPSFAPGPHDMMKDCPLAVNATAATSRSSTQASDPGRIAEAVLPSFEKHVARSDNDTVVSFRPNRGPTHLRFCVFLI